MSRTNPPMFKKTQHVACLRPDKATADGSGLGCEQEAGLETFRAAPPASTCVSL